MTGKQPKRKERPGVDRMGRTALHYAALAGDAARVRELLASGLAAGAADDNGSTPLHFAAESSADEVTALLLQAGASVHARDSYGNTPLWTAVFNSCGHGAIIEQLRAQGADPLATNKHGNSPLSLARLIANYDVRQYFVDIPE